MNTALIAAALKALHGGLASPLFEVVVELPSTYTDKLGLTKFEVVAGTFSDFDQAAAAIGRRDADGARKCWVTLNPLARAVAPSGQLRRTRHRAGDDDVAARQWLLVDFDSRRPDPKHTNATETELAAALYARDLANRELQAEGWPQPLVAMSGNGGALVYPVDLPADDGGLCAQVLGRLAERFDGDGAAVDTTVSNASRVWNIAGTTARKGPHTAERPQRLTVLEPPALRTAAMGADFLRRWLEGQGVPPTVLVRPAKKAKPRTGADLPNAAQEIVNGQAHVGSGEAFQTLGRFVNSLVGAGYSDEQVANLANEHAGALGLADRKDAARARQVEQACLDARRYQAGHESKGRTAARDYAERARRNLPAFGTGTPALSRQRVYLAMCTLAAKAGRVRNFSAAARDVALIAGTRRGAATRLIHDLECNGLVTCDWRSAIDVNGTRPGMSRPNRYTLHPVRPKSESVEPFLLSSMRSGPVDSLPDAFRDKPLPPAVTYGMATRRGWTLKRLGGKWGRSWVVRGLGAAAWAIWNSLSTAEPLNVNQLAEAVGVHAQTVRAALQATSDGRTVTLEGRKYRTPALGLVVRVQGGWLKAPGADLDNAASLLGTVGATENQRREYAEDRRRFARGASGAVELFKAATNLQVMTVPSTAEDER